MPKYNITVRSEIEVTAPNIAKAFEVARNKIRIVGEHLGSRRSRNERDMWDTGLKILSTVFDKPRRKSD